MKKTGLIVGGIVAAGLLLSVGFVVETLRADAQNTGLPGIQVRVINVDKVFKNYSKFKNMFEQMKVDVQKKQEELRAIQTQMQAKKDSVASVKAQADRDRIEKELADLQLTLSQKERQYRGEFAQYEANMFMTAYKEMSELLSKYCEQNHIHMVVRTVDVGEAQSAQMIVAQINQQVVYHHKNLDLTDVITEGLNHLMTTK